MDSTSRAPALALAVVVAAVPVGVLAQSTRVVHAHARGDAAIAIDGVLDEPVWHAAEEASHFVQREPRAGRRPPVDTHVRVLFDADALYVGIVCDLLPGEIPRALESRRDSGDIYAEDAVTVKLDVAHDRRTTIGFAVNPINTQLDFVATENGQNVRYEYDAVWESATSIGPHSWIAELRIPATALGLSDVAGARLIGLNISRDQHARLSTDDWALMPPEFGPYSAQHYGDLVGVEGMGGGVPLSLAPYVLARYPGDLLHVGDGLDLRAGGEARLRVGEDIWGELTVLTDFAQVDLDDPVNNLDRFPLFLPEKRPFFLSGLDVFDLGASGEAQLFFSRRIGLDAEGHEVPLFGGLKLYGHQGPVGFGLLDALTDDPVTHWAVARTRLNIGKTAHLGAMATARNRLEDLPPVDPALPPPLDPPPPERGYSVGLDGSARIERRLDLSASASSAPVDGARLVDASSARIGASLEGEVAQPSASALWVGHAFDPDVGFVQRRGVLRLRGQVPLTLRPDALGLEAIFTGVTTRIDLDDRVDRRLTSLVDAWFDLDWPTWGFDSQLEWREDVVESAFEVVPGLVVPPGAYRGLTATYDLWFSGRRNPSGGITYRGSNAFFGNTIHTIEPRVRVRFRRYARINLSASYSRIHTPDDRSFAAGTFTGTLSITPASTLAVDLVGQYESESRRHVGMLRARWRYLPGSDLFFVYRHELPTDRAGAPLEWSVTLKAAYRFDALL